MVWPTHKQERQPKKHILSSNSAHSDLKCVRLCTHTHQKLNPYTTIYLDRLRSTTPSSLGFHGMHAQRALQNNSGIQ